MKWDIQAQSEAWNARGLWRELREIESVSGPVIELHGRELVNFSSNDYLGLAGSEELQDALHEGVDRYGAGAGASRLVCGTQSPHLALEKSLAQFKGTESALVFSSGYATALGAIPALVGQGDTVIIDKLCHASLVDAARLSGAVLRVFPHNHLARLEKLLQTANGRVLVVTESIFSMDGDRSDLANIIELKNRYGAWLLLDEAHAVGVLGPQGRGLAAELGIEAEVDLHMGTLSKALGLSGGYLAAKREVIDWLINRARSFVYSTAMLPSLAHAATKAIELMAGSVGDERRIRLMQHLQQLNGGKSPPSAILPLILGEESAAIAASQRLMEAGFLIPAIRYPTVARGAARLRLTCTATHTKVQMDALQKELATQGFH
jgi:8-amino-7-oxononanoate synthase